MSAGSGGFYVITGDLAHFDPCHRAVSFRKPSAVQNPPLVIMLHGGAGLTNSTTSLATELRRQGFATLTFDAYRMNGFNRDPMFWNTRVNPAPKQHMLFKIALGAYEWALTRTDIDTNSIYFYGISNGATVVLNLAAITSPEHVRGVFAEGAPSVGLGLPDTLVVPVRLIYGKLDNHSGRHESDWMWLRSSECFLHKPHDLSPQGTAHWCHIPRNFNSVAISPLDWSNRQKDSGADLEVWFYEDGAHDFFYGPIDRGMLVINERFNRFAWVGASRATQRSMISDIVNFHNKTSGMPN